MLKVIFYILSFTWGLIMTLIGGLVALVLLCLGHRPTKYGPCLCFEVGEYWGAISLGLVIICGMDGDVYTKNHELGHSVQNAVFGPLFVIFIAIPSFIRCQYYNWVGAHNSKKFADLPDYYSIWFEGGASKWGEKFILNWN